MSQLDQADEQRLPGDLLLNESHAAAGEHALHQLGQSLGVEVEDVDLSKPLAPTHDENKGFMRFMPALIKEMNRHGVPFTIDGSSGEITIGGFYRNGPMKLEVEANDDIVAIDKRARRKVMKSYDDLVQLNFEWWRRSTGKGINLNPDRPWLDAFITKNWVKRQVIFVPREDQGPTPDDAE